MSQSLSAFQAAKLAEKEAKAAKLAAKKEANAAAAAALAAKKSAAGGAGGGGAGEDKKAAAEAKKVYYMRLVQAMQLDEMNVTLDTVHLSKKPASFTLSIKPWRTR